MHATVDEIPDWKRPSSIIQYDPLPDGRARIWCRWCGSSVELQLNRDPVTADCPNCGGPR
jgi:hypothetical protein